MAYLDAEKALRKAIFQALNNNVVVGGDTIPVYDEFAADDAPDLFIVIGNQYGDNRFTFQKWVTGCVIILQVVQTQKRAISKDLIDEVAETMKGILLPTPYTTGLSIDSPLSINNLYRESSSYLSEQNNTNWVMRKIERYRVNVQQD
jgi:hypothetical protein